VFGDSVLYADSTVEDVSSKAGVLMSDAQRIKYRAEIQAKYRELADRHEKESVQLRELLLT
jgi:hypothetical protein